MIDHTIVPLDMHGIYDEGSMEKNSPTITINIYLTPEKIENVYIGVECSPEEIHIYTKLLKEF